MVVVLEAQQPGPGSISRFQWWSTPSRSNGAGRAASNGLRTKQTCRCRVEQASASLRDPGGRCVECFVGGDADWRCGLKSASRAPYVIGQSVLQFLSCRPSALERHHHQDGQPRYVSCRLKQEIGRMPWETRLRVRRSKLRCVSNLGGGRVNIGR